MAQRETTIRIVGDPLGVCHKILKREEFARHRKVLLRMLKFVGILP